MDRRPEIAKKVAKFLLADGFYIHSLFRVTTFEEILERSSAKDIELFTENSEFVTELIESMEKIIRYEDKKHRRRNLEQRRN